MQYRIMTNDKITDFKTKADADVLFASEKTKVEKAEITTDKDGKKTIPTVSIHLCYHDEHPPRPCVIIQKVEATKIAVVKEEVKGGVIK